MPEFLTETGEFTDEFRAALPEMFGEEHKDSKVMDDITSISALVKSHADTKSALGKKLENVIQKPADDASEEVKAAYRAELAAAMGAPATAAEYKFFRSEKLPDGLERSQELEDKMRALLFEHKASKALVAALSQAFEEFQINNFNSLMAADTEAAAKAADDAQKAFDAECTALKTDWAGDALATNARISLAAINKFGSAELVKKLKEAGMYENATDLAKWKEAGVPISTLRLFHKIGLETLDASVLGAGGGGEKPKKSMYQRTKAQLGES